MKAYLWEGYAAVGTMLGVAETKEEAIAQIRAWLNKEPFTQKAHNILNAEMNEAFQTEPKVFDLPMGIATWGDLASEIKELTAHIELL